MTEYDAQINKLSMILEKEPEKKRLMAKIEKTNAILATGLSRACLMFNGTLTPPWKLNGACGSKGIGIYNNIVLRVASASISR